MVKSKTNAIKESKELQESEYIDSKKLSSIGIPPHILAKIQAKKTWVNGKGQPMFDTLGDIKKIRYSTFLNLVDLNKDEVRTLEKKLLANGYYNDSFSITPYEVKLADIGLNFDKMLPKNIKHRKRICDLDIVADLFYDFGSQTFIRAVNDPKILAEIERRLNTIGVSLYNFYSLNGSFGNKAATKPKKREIKATFTNNFDTTEEQEKSENKKPFQFSYTPQSYNYVEQGNVMRYEPPKVSPAQKSTSTELSSLEFKIFHFGIESIEKLDNSWFVPNGEKLQSLIALIDKYVNSCKEANEKAAAQKSDMPKIDTDAILNYAYNYINKRSAQLASQVSQAEVTETNQTNQTQPQ
jgi:hypothetical protein